MKLRQAFLASCALLALGGFAQAATKLTIATVNNGDMIRMQKLTDDFTTEIGRASCRERVSYSV